MLHELLLALQGCPGSIFVKADENQLKVVEGLVFLHPAETSILKKLCTLGSNYCVIEKFIDRFSQPSKGGGIYLSALCRGLNILISKYSDLLLELEKECLKDPCLSLSHFQYRLNEYQMLFPIVLSLLDEIENLEARGCYILELVFRRSVSGIPFVQTSFKKILAVCHGVLYKQLTAWLLYGIITDDYNELFIQDVPIAAANSHSSHTTDVCENESRCRRRMYQLRADLLPSYIPHRVANKVIFIGESVQLFSEKKDAKSSHLTDTSMFEGKEAAFCEQLHSLQQKEEFNLSSFEGVLDDIRSSVAQNLWRLVVEESDLIGKFNQIKNYFLLARGELFLEFIDQIDSTLLSPPISSTEHDVNVAFQAAGRSVLLDEKNESEIAKFRFKVKGNTSGQKDQKSSQRKVESGWNLISLEYDISWPLHILFTPSTLSRYDTVFKFLLTVKRVQSALHKCWSLQMVNKQADSQNVAVWQLRYHMSFIVDNLQYYLQADVLESQFYALIEKINSTRDFEEIHHAHEQFITSILAQTFLLTKPVSKCLNEMLNLCFMFCKLMTCTPLEYWTETERKQVDRLGQQFNRHIALLFKILSSVSHQSSPHLAQLLLRIDYNKFLSNVSGHLGI